MAPSADRSPTEIETLVPEITELARQLEDEVCCDEGTFFLLHSYVTLWSTRRHGPLTAEGARRAEAGLRRIVEATLPLREAPALDRALAVVGTLAGAEDRRGHITEVTTPALDRGYLAYASGDWDASVSIAGNAVKARAARREDCLRQLESACRARWAADSAAPVVPAHPPDGGSEPASGKVIAVIGPNGWRRA